ncbi:MAG: hypothetical protein NTV52_25565 [Acidobacteria bacterium]|nr:hypothetical protein [Acidobacteriota bacterium]
MRYKLALGLALTSLLSCPSEAQRSTVAVEAFGGGPLPITADVESECGFGVRKAQGRTIAVEALIGKFCRITVQGHLSGGKTVWLVPSSPSEYLRVKLPLTALINLSNDDHEYAQKQIYLRCYFTSTSKFRIFAISEADDWIREGEQLSPGRFYFARMRLGEIKLLVQIRPDVQYPVHIFANYKKEEIEIPCPY